MYRRRRLLPSLLKIHGFLSFLNNTVRNWKSGGCKLTPVQRVNEGRGCSGWEMNERRESFYTTPGWRNVRRPRVVTFSPRRGQEFQVKSSPPDVIRRTSHMTNTGSAWCFHCYLHTTVYYVKQQIRACWGRVTQRLEKFALQFLHVRGKRFVCVSLHGKNCLFLYKVLTHQPNLSI